MPALDIFKSDRANRGGHYSVGQRSGEIAATLAAAAHLARIRWAPADSDGPPYCLVRGIEVGVTISGAVTTAVELALRAIIVRSFSVDFTTNMTSINLATTNAGLSNSNGGALYKPSRMGTSGPGVCTTAALSGQTLTADAAPFALRSFPNPSPTLGAAALTNQVGAGVDMQPLYNWNGQIEDAIILSSQEGIVVQNHLAGPGTGTFGLYVRWHWSELYKIPGVV